jgi:hypothetical protein
MKLTAWPEDRRIGAKRFRREAFQIAFSGGEDTAAERIIWDQFYGPHKNALERMPDNDVIMWCLLVMLCGGNTRTSPTMLEFNAVCFDPVMEGEGFTFTVSMAGSTLAEELRRLGMLLTRLRRGQKGIISVYAFFETEGGRLELRIYPHRFSVFYKALKILWAKYGQEGIMTVQDLIAWAYHLIAPENFEEPMKYQVVP